MVKHQYEQTVQHIIIPKHTPTTMKCIKTNWRNIIQKHNPCRHSNNSEKNKTNWANSITNHNPERQANTSDKTTNCNSIIINHNPNRLWVMVFNTTFTNISVKSWRSVFLVAETGEPGENHRPEASHWQTLWHNVVSGKPRLSRVRTHTVSGDRP
jgi:hypothetical protein